MTNNRNGPGALAGATEAENDGAQSGQAAQHSNSTPPPPLEPCAATMAEHIANIADVYAGHDGLTEIAWDTRVADGRSELSCARLFRPEETDAMVALASKVNRAGANVYIGPALRRPDAPRGKRAEDADVIAVCWVWADFDDDGALDAALEAFNAIGAEPNLVTLTGETPHRRGQCWWMLTAAAPRDELKRLLADIAARFKGDSSVQNRGRVMRLAGSIAHPRKPGRVPEMTRALHEHTRVASYVFAELRALLAPSPLNGAITKPQGEVSSVMSVLSGQPEDLEPGPSRGELKDLLSRLDPDMPYGDWVRVGMALHLETRGSAWALEVWDQWSAGGQKYREGEPATKWKSFRPNPETSVTIASIHRMAAPQAARVQTSDTPDKTGTTDKTPPDMSLLRTDRRHAPVLPADTFRPILWKWICEAAESKGAPPDYVAGGLLSCASGLVGTARWVEPWPGWREPILIWALLIGDPSANKSPGLDAPADVARAVEREIKTKALAEYAAWAERRDTAAAAEPPEDFDEPAPHIPSLILHDATVERIGEILSRQPRGAMFMFDELASWLTNMSRYSRGDDRGFWIASFGGRPYSVRRMSRDDLDIDAVALVVCGCIQPDRFASLLTKADDDGLASRFIPFHPDPAPVRRPCVVPNSDFLLRSFRRLAELDQRTPTMLFEEPARLEIDAVRVWARATELDTEGMLKSFVGKCPGFTVRLAGLLTLLDWAGGPHDTAPTIIGVEQAKRARRFVQDYAFKMAERAYGDAAAPPEMRAARRLARLIVQEKITTFTLGDILRRERKGLATMKDVEAAVDVLVQQGWCVHLAGKSGPQGGRPRRRYGVNAKVHKDQMSGAAP